MSSYKANAVGLAAMRPHDCGCTTTLDKVEVEGGIPGRGGDEKGPTDEMAAKHQNLPKAGYRACVAFRVPIYLPERNSKRLHTGEGADITCEGLSRADSLQSSPVASL